MHYEDWNDLVIRTLHYGMTDRDIASDSATDVDLSDGNALVIGLNFWCAFFYLIHGY